MTSWASRRPGGYWIAVWAGNAAIAVAFVAYAAVFWSELASNKLLGALVAVALIWLLTLVNALGTRESGGVQLVTTVLKFVPLAVIGLIGLFFVNGDNYTPFAPDGTWTAISAAAPLTLWAFIGLESATVPAEEVRDPERTIPRATMLGTVITTVLYIVATVAIMGIIPATQLAGSTSPFADAAGEIFGGGWDKVIAAVAMISTLGALNGWILLRGRVPLAAAEDGLFPSAFAKVHGERRTPVFGLVVSSVLATALVLMNYTKGLLDAFEFVILLATLDDARSVRVLRRGAGVSLRHRARALLAGPLLARHRDRGAGIRVLGLGDHGLRRGHHRQGLRALAGRYARSMSGCAGGSSVTLPGRPAEPADDRATVITNGRFTPAGKEGGVPA